MVMYEATPPRNKIDLYRAPKHSNNKFYKRTVNKKSSQTSEIAVKISEKRSELALERAFKPTKGVTMLTAGTVVSSLASKEQIVTYETRTGCTLFILILTRLTNCHCLRLSPSPKRY